MFIIPAVDIKEGSCVQLVGGKEGTEQFYGDPLEVALKWQESGAPLLHVVDLDAAMGKSDNLQLVSRISRKLDIPIQFGGGIRDFGSVEHVLSKGVDRVILGTLAVEDYKNDFPIIRKLNEIYGRNRLLVAVDSKKGKIVTHGWKEKTDIKTTDFIEEVDDLVWGFLYTNVEVEGKMQGIDVERTKEVVSSTALPVIVSGGVSRKKDLRNLEKIGTWGVVIGKALYEDKLSFLKDEDA